ncbi:MAG TPA: ribonuclease H-like domain-containing protein [Candidatus Krumholzibacteria bacterium]|nr:ribonuclease H-like domain-containing protein [Candidatus Krumholzibacteria bacterium]HRX51662.1 ribonuclease H-like domain-containing protein [Candidatus Krumholzibacteria bacterium]
MDLRSRLARLDRSVGAKPADPAPEPADRAALLEGLGLTRREGAAGPVWSRESRTPIPPPPGSPAALAPLLTWTPSTDLTWDDVLLLDTETTGLAGGTGTLPFLVGLGWWEDGALRVRLDFLGSPAGEAALLADLDAFARGFRAVVTFNGNGFDLPLLRTRGILARRRDLLGHLEPLDLLPACRRLWGRRLPDVRQGTVERLVADVIRDGQDIPGAAIPRAWTDLVLQGRADDAALVLDHNRWDVEGMAAILHRAVEALAVHRAGPDACPDTLSWPDAWSLARLAERGGDARLAAAWMEAALVRAPVGEFPRLHRLGPPAPFWLDAVRLLKRTGDWPRVGALLELARGFVGREAWWHREAAILHEHRLVDLERALRHARRADDPRRVERLERKLGRGRPPVADGGPAR